MKKKKKPFLLFEVLLSFVLLMGLFFPMLKVHFAIGTQELKRGELMAFERMSKNVFALIEEELYENRFHTFEELKKGGSFELKRPIFNSIGKKYDVKYEIIPIECVTKKSNGERYLVFDCKLSFMSKEILKGTYKTTYLVQEHEKT